jgi:hypothetical protein
MLHALKAPKSSKINIFAALFLTMAETLGMLCDKLTIVRLKHYHTEDKERLAGLEKQTAQLQAEIDDYISDAVHGNIPVEKMTFDAHKVFKKEGNTVQDVQGDLGEVMYQLADVNCRLWHEQEKVYDFENVPVSEKDKVVKQLALLNLERNKCIDRINNLFAGLIRNK